MALFAYDAMGSEDISMRKGDLLRLVEERDNEWWLVGVVVVIRIMVGLAIRISVCYQRREKNINKVALNLSCRMAETHFQLLSCP